MQGIKGGSVAAGGGGDCPVVRLFSQTLSAASNSVTIDLSGVDLSQYVELELCMDSFSNTTRSSQGFYATLSNGSESNVYSITTLFSDYKYSLRYRFADAGSLIGAAVGNAPRYESGSLNVASISGGYWDKHTLADVKTMTLGVSGGSLASGSVIVLYGLKK